MFSFLHRRNLSAPEPDEKSKKILRSLIAEFGVFLKDSINVTMKISLSLLTPRYLCLPPKLFLSALKIFSCDS